MATIREFFQNLLYQVPAIGITDIVDILVVSIIFYSLLRLIRSTSAARVARAILLLLAITLLTDVLNLYTLNWLLNKILEVGAIALIIVFQPELRSMLEKMGGESIKGIKSRFDRTSSEGFRPKLAELCYAAETLSASKTGALIVFERGTKLGDVIRTGTVIDAEISAFLIGNIFFNKAPLHDGALIIRNERLYAAGCFLPLSTNPDIVKDLGTRHRAGIGMSENSDAVVLIVSEETGVISVAVDGVLKRGFSKKTLEAYLSGLLIDEQKSKPSARFRIFGRKRDDKPEE